MEEKIYNPKIYSDEDLKNKSGIYQIKNLVNNKLYIGSANNLYRRKNREHFYRLAQNKHCNDKLQDAFNKYGEQNFVFEVIEFVEDKDNLLECEQYWLDRFNVVEKGYNIQPIAGKIYMTDEIKLKISKSNKGHVSPRKGIKLSDETKQKISNARKGKYHKENSFWFGKHLTEETKQKISASKLGKIPWNKGKTGIYSEESLQKMSKSRKGKYYAENHPMYGRHHTEESKLKMSENHADVSGSKNPMFGKTGRENPRSIWVIRISDNKVFYSLKECAKNNNTYVDRIKKHCENMVENPEYKYYNKKGE